MKFDKKPAHTTTIDGQEVELVLDMRAKGLLAVYLSQHEQEKNNPFVVVCATMAAMINSAAIRAGKPDEQVTVDDMLTSNVDPAEMRRVIEDVTTNAYHMEYKKENSSNDLYADEVADNEKNREAGVS